MKMEIFAKSDCDSIIIFSNGAIVIKSFKVRFQDKEDKEIVIRNLDNNIDFSSMEITSDFKVADLSFDKEEIDLEDLINFDDDAKRLLILNERIKTLDAKIKAYKEALREIIAKFAENNLLGKVDSKRFDELYNYIEDDVAFSKYSIGVINVRRKMIMEKLAKKGLVQARKSRLSIKVDRGDNDEGTISLKYLIWNIEWKPFYKVRVREGKIEVSLFAIITPKNSDLMRTSKLILLGKKLEKIRLSKVRPWYISPGRAIKMAKMVQAAPVGRGPAIAIPVPEKFEREEEVYEQPKVGFGEEIKVEVDREVILEPNKENLIFISKREFEGKEIYIWNAPYGTLVTRAFEFKIDIPLVPGKGMVLSEGIPIGEISFDYKPKGSEITIPLEWERNIVCKKELIKREGEKKGMVREKAVRIFEYHLTCKNFKDKDVDMLIVDRIPQSTDPRIKVKLEYAEPEPYEQKLGVMKWKLRIKMGEEGVIKYKFRVEHPLDMEITL